MDMAWIERSRGHPQIAIEYGERAVTEAEAAGREHTTIRIQEQLGSVLKSVGRYAEARVAIERGIAGFRAIGDDSNVAIALSNLADLDFLGGDYDSAYERFTAAAEMTAATGHVIARGAALGGAAASLLALGRRSEAIAGFLAALEIADEARIVPELAHSLGMIALAAASADAMPAARLRGAVGELRRLNGLKLQPHDEAFERRLEQPTRDALGEATFTR
jgi:tetratricopeptide (TPR) repeat protein